MSSRLSTENSPSPRFFLFFLSFLKNSSTGYPVRPCPSVRNGGSQNKKGKQTMPSGFFFRPGIGTRCRVYNRIHCCCLFYIYANFTCPAVPTLYSYEVIFSSGPSLFSRLSFRYFSSSSSFVF